MMDLNKTALLAIDLIKAFSPRDLYSKTQLPVDQLTSDRRSNINKLLHWSETNKFLTIFISDAHHYEDFERMNEPVHALHDTEQSELMDWVYQAKNALIIKKRTYDGTTNPKLIEMLKDNKISRLIIIGTSTGACVLRTIKGLMNRGYKDILLVEDACADIFPIRHRKSIQMMKNLEKFNVIMTKECRKKQYSKKISSLIER